MSQGSGQEAESVGVIHDEPMRRLENAGAWSTNEHDNLAENTWKQGGIHTQEGGRENRPRVWYIREKLVITRVGRGVMRP